MWTWAYRAAWSAARVVAPLVAGGDGKLARAVRGRLASAADLGRWAASHRDTSRPLVWFHAASVGEGRQAEAVITRLRQRHPDWQLAFTHSSASSEKFAASLPVDVACYVPADTAPETGAALDALRPRALVFSATDLWPELVRQAAARGVRLGLISATLAPTSSRRGAAANALLRGTYAALDAVGAIDDADAAGLASLGVRPNRIAITGDTRHDAAATRAAAVDKGRPALRALLRAAAGAPLLVAGSTWPADERALIPAMATVRARHPLRLVIAPHEPDAAHLESLEQRIGATLADARVTRLSAIESAESVPGGVPPAIPDWSVCLVDRVGLLADLYAAGHLAFVGGGFHNAGLHAVIEPAALGVPVLFGPRWQSSRDARLLQDHGGARSAADAGALAAALETWLADPAARAGAGAAARAVVDEGLGAAERSVGVVEKLVKAEG